MGGYVKQRTTGVAFGVAAASEIDVKTYQRLRFVRHSLLAFLKKTNFNGFETFSPIQKPNKQVVTEPIQP